MRPGKGLDALRECLGEERGSLDGPDATSGVGVTPRFARRAEAPAAPSGVAA